MTTITIKEQGTAAAGHVVSIDGQEYPFTLEDPFTEQDEERLEWYFEEHLTFPFTKQERAREAAASITAYGHALFNQVFGDRRTYARYQGALQQGIEKLVFEIAGKAEFHHLHWEALKAPELSQPYLDATAEQVVELFGSALSHQAAARTDGRHPISTPRGNGYVPIYMRVGRALGRGRLSWCAGNGQHVGRPVTTRFSD